VEVKQRTLELGASQLRVADKGRQRGSESNNGHENGNRSAIGPASFQQYRLGNKRNPMHRIGSNPQRNENQTGKDPLEMIQSNDKRYLSFLTRY
jgi:hypothetical protein